MSEKSAKALRKTDAKNAKANKAAPKGAVKYAAGKDKDTAKKAAPKKKAKKA